MGGLHDLDTTIVAVASPPGRGGVGCVRVSGPDAWRIAKALCPAAPAAPDEGRPSLCFTRFRGRDGQPLDHGFLAAFPAGRSYTGETTVELWPHGSPAVLRELIDAAVEAGAEPAGPGEFTYRALRNGRLDLARAEAVRDLIAARTLFQARVAFAQVEGALSRHLTPMRESLAEWMARGEAAVEFVDESETHLARGELERGIASLVEGCDRLLADFRTGRVVREGARMAITGRPNAGKSSLFNRLLARERAIVTETPGTTRDTLEETISIGGVPLTLIDTAGDREARDPVETEGVRRARAAREQADLELRVLDGTEERHGVVEPGPRVVVVLNKSDLDSFAGRPLPHPDVLRVSAKTGSGLDALRAQLRDRLLGHEALDSPLLTDARHARSLERCRDALGRASETLSSGLTEELALEDLREALDQLGAITGERGTEELYDRIFSTFCIGK